MSGTALRKSVGEPLTADVGIYPIPAGHEVADGINGLTQSRSRAGRDDGVHRTKAVATGPASRTADGATKRAVSPILVVAGSSALAGAAAGIVAAVTVLDAVVQLPLAAVLAFAVAGATAVGLPAALAIGARGAAAGVPPMSLGGRRDARDVLDAELQRSRRYERPLAVVRVSAAAGRDEDRRERVEVSAACAARLDQSLRATDHWWHEGSALYFVLPESDRAHAHAWVHRLREAVPGLPTQVSIAVFPQDGITRAAMWAALARSPELSEAR
jgi:hypothetical protein